MDERLFTSKEFGKLEWQQSGAYYYFVPKPLPPKYIPSLKVDKQFEKTLILLGMLKAKAQDFSKEEIFLLQYPFMLKEATLSSEIEGTRSTIADVLKAEKVEEKNAEKRLDNQEINNYRKALQYGLKKVLELGTITEELIKEIHKMLLEGVRGKDKTPGEYKTSQNGIGNREDTLDIARFVPASPEETPTLMKNLIEFINSDECSSLYKIAVTHYQFEAIHAFRDGNGRLGRLLIMLNICKDKILDYPLLYISEYFNRNRDSYTDALFNVSARGDLEGWIVFFLRALEYQAQQSIKLLENLQDYKYELQEQMRLLSKSPNMHMLINYLFKHPFITSTEIKKMLKITQPAAWGLIKKLEEENILKFTETTKEGNIYRAEKILNIILGS